jgi:hypothetical protein
MTLSGMSTLQQVEENLAVAADKKPLAAPEKKRIAEHLSRLKKMANLYCTGCNYCMPCPEGVAISRVFGLYNQARIYGLWEHARTQHADLIAKAPSHGHPANKCIECGACESKCPQKIAIRKQLKEAHRALTRRK